MDDKCRLPLPTVRFLKRAHAAAYLGVGVTTFDAEIRAAMWPKPMRRGAQTTALTWDRKLLDQAADRLAGLIDADSPGNDLKAAEQAALEAIARGTTKAQSKNSRPRRSG
jgi:hypothetical protein